MVGTGDDKVGLRCRCASSPRYIFFFFLISTNDYLNVDDVYDKDDAGC